MSSSESLLLIKQIQAATILQDQFRKHQRDREQNGLNLSASIRWNEIVKQQNLKSARRFSQQESIPNDTHSRWHRAGVFTSSLVVTSPSSPSNEEALFSPVYAQAPSKTMDPTYWLEMVDHKHRYGSNLKAYHTYWNNHYQGDQNFFYWLDHGEGRQLDLPDSPRERLDSETITYLTLEQKQNYLVRIDSNGKLVWAKDSRPVDTAPGKHKDLGNGQGIADLTPEEFEAAKARGEIHSSSSESRSSAESSRIAQDAHHYALGQRAESSLTAKVKTRIKPKAIMDHLLRKTLNANTWIFVADHRGNMYVGIKQTGKFQHSSFLAGSRVLAAGLLRADQGQLTSLSPLSGHYRAGSDQFKSFVKILEHEWGCDMSRVSIPKALFVIGALEKFAVISKKTTELKVKIKKIFHHNDQKSSETEKTAQENKDDQPFELVADSVSETEEWKETVRVNRLARIAGEEERQRIKTLQDGRTGTNVWPSLPHEGKKVEEMTDDERVERGAALIARAVARQGKR